MRIRSYLFSMLDCALEINIIIIKCWKLFSATLKTLCWLACIMHIVRGFIVLETSNVLILTVLLFNPL